MSTTLLVASIPSIVTPTTAPTSIPSSTFYHHRYNNNNPHAHPDAPKASAALFLFFVLLIFFLVILYHFFYIYIVRRSPYYYSVQSEYDPSIYNVERIIPLRERLRRYRGRPRSNSDIFRDEDLERVRQELSTKGWKGRVNSDGTPNTNHRGWDDRAGVGFVGAGGMVGGWGLDRTIHYDRDEEYGPRQYVETEDTPFWRDRRWGGSVTKDANQEGSMRQKGFIPSYGSFREYGMFGESPTGRVIPGLSQNGFPTGIATPEFGSHASTAGKGVGGYGLNAAFSYQASPGNTRFVTPPIRASSKILERLNHTGLRYSTDRNARFPDEELQDHYKGLCDSEDAALKDLEDARDQAAVEATYGDANARTAANTQKIIERLTALEKKLLYAVKRRTVFSDRFAIRADVIAEEAGESSASASNEPPPPYTDIEVHGARMSFDEEREARH